MNEIVRYHNDMNLVVFKDFTEIDYNNFFAVCYKLKEQGTDQVTMTFSELKELANFRKKDDKEFLSKLVGIYDKILKMTLMDSGFANEKIKRFSVFRNFIVDPKEQTLSIQINEDFLYVLNDLNRNFTRFELAEFCSISTKYAKNLYRYFKQFKTTGEVFFTWEGFKTFLSIPDSYNSAMIDVRIIKPAIEELKDKFRDLTYIKGKGSGRGNGGIITTITFRFLADYYDKAPPSKYDYKDPEHEKAFSGLISFKNYICKKFSPQGESKYRFFTRHKGYDLFIKLGNNGQKYLARAYYHEDRKEFLDTELKPEEAIEIWGELLQRAKKNDIPQLNQNLLDYAQKGENDK